MESVLAQLSALLRVKVIILGIGNVLRQDDAFGSRLAQDLKDRIKFKVYDAGSSPENFLGVIIKEAPAVVLLIDAADFGGGAGEIRLLSSEDIKSKNFFLTHDTSVGALLDYLEKNSPAKIFLLAIQPKTVGFGQGLSQDLENVFQELEGWFLDKYEKQK